MGKHQETVLLESIQKKIKLIDACILVCQILGSIFEHKYPFLISNQK